MANRSYLYATNKSLQKIRDLSECNYSIPLVYKILLGVGTEQLRSQIWYECKDNIAYWGNFKKGLKKYLDLLEFLGTLPNMDQALLATYAQQTQDFFKEFPDKKGYYFLLEAGEVFTLTDDPLDEQAHDLFREIGFISKDIDRVLEERPKDLFEREKNQGWVWQVKKDVTELEPYWAQVCYYSFNKV